MSTCIADKASCHCQLTAVLRPHTQTHIQALVELTAWIAVNMLLPACIANNTHDARLTDGINKLGNQQSWVLYHVQH